MDSTNSTCLFAFIVIGGAIAFAVFLFYLSERNALERRKQAFLRTKLVEDLMALSPIAFENYVAEYFRYWGYSATTTRASNDKGVDIYVERPGEWAIVQCKRYRGTVGAPVIRELYGTLIHSQRNKAYLITTGKFSKEAALFASGKPIELIDGQKFAYLISDLHKRIASANNNKQSSD